MDSTPCLMKNSVPGNAYGIKKKKEMASGF